MKNCFWRNGMGVAVYEKGLFYKDVCGKGMRKAGGIRKALREHTNKWEGLMKEEYVYSGDLPGEGIFECEECGAEIVLNDLDKVPCCPCCTGKTFARR